MGLFGLSCLVALLALALGASATSVSCKHTFESHGATFDLSPFVLPSGQMYQVMDKKDEEEIDFDYVFNICNDLTVLPEPDAKDGGGCKVGEDGSVGAAYQLLNKSDSVNCWSLGTAKSMTWELLDETDATVGVQVSYTDGEACAHSPLHDRRSIVFKFQCGVEETTTPVTRVEEFEHCSYTLTFNSIHACPRDCVTSSNQLCGGHGLCALDHKTQNTHCFCNNGRKGELCTSKQNASSSATASGVMAGFSIALLLILLGVGGYLFYTIRQLKVEGSEYGGLEDMVKDVTAAGPDSEYKVSQIHG